MDFTRAFDKNDLLKFIKHGDFSSVEQILKSSGEIYIRRGSVGCQPPLQIAAQYGKSEIIKLLLQYGVDVNEVSYDKKSALMYATMSCDKASVKILLDHGGEIKQSNWGLITMLHVAAVAGDVNLVNESLAQGLTLKEESIDAFNALHFAASAGNREIVKILLQNFGTDVDTNDQLLLHQAAFGGNVEIVKIFLELGCDIHQKAYGNISLLHSAAKGGYLEMVEFILEQGIHFDVKNDCGQNCLFFAAESSRPIDEIVRLFLSLGLDIDEADEEGNTPLNYIADLASLWDHNWDHSIESLLKHGANTETVNSKGVTPLFALCSRGLNKNPVYSLLSHGADVNRKNDRGLTVLHAVFEKMPRYRYEIIVEVVEEIIEVGVDTMATDNYGKTALSYAFERIEKYDSNKITKLARKKEIIRLFFIKPTQ